MRVEVIVIVGLLVLALLLLNAIFLAVIYFMRRKMREVSEWPYTQGRVTESALESRSGEEGSTDYPRVRYSYQMLGRAYQGSQIATGPEVGGSGARRVIERYPAGAAVRVYYNPQNPEEAVLEQKAPAMTLMWAILAVFDCALLGAIAAVVWGFAYHAGG
ncbi:MAG TPA: DUF3592 domain-containing protein [Anaerolineales bacterium]